VVAYPTIEFASHNTTKSSAGWAITGTLLVHGRRQNITLTITNLARDGETVRLAATASINRNDFGVTAMKVVIGPKIDLHIDAIATRV
jgi:polyisoprenoid-binding protein YceI